MDVALAAQSLAGNFMIVVQYNRDNTAFEVSQSWFLYSETRQYFGILLCIKKAFLFLFYALCVTAGVDYCRVL